VLGYNAAGLGFESRYGYFYLILFFFCVS